MPGPVDLHLLFLGEKVNCLQCNTESMLYLSGISWGRVRVEEERTHSREAGSSAYKAKPWFLIPFLLSKFFSVTE